MYDRIVEKTSKQGVRPGDRVGCFLSVAHGRGLFLGFGTYVGEEVPPNEGLSSLTGYLSGLRQANPKLVLDNGDVVWGCECWWGPEEEIKAERAGLSEVRDITIADARAGRIPDGFRDQAGPQHDDDADDFYGDKGSGGKDFWS